MPNPEGSKLLYLPPELMELFPLLNSRNLQEFLWSITEWKDKIIWKKEMKDYLKTHEKIAKILIDVIQI